MSSNEERAAFEAWAMGEFELAGLPTRAGLGYKLTGVDDSWAGWQAAWKARATAPQATVKGDPTGSYRDATGELVLPLDRAAAPQSLKGGERHCFTCGRQIEAASVAAPQAGAPNDAAITACALMIKGICMTLPQDQWSRKIEERIRFMLATPQAEK